MIKKTCLWIFVSLVGVLVIFGGCSQISYKEMTIREFTNVERLPQIDPDYHQIVIPPNIAPLNFMIQESGSHFYVKISSVNGQPIHISSKNGKIIIPLKEWQNLLGFNQGEQLNFEFFVADQNGQWQRFKTITNQIAREPIDGYLAYRLLHPAYNLWKKMGIYQRNLQNFEQKPILINRITSENCMNCHSFCNNNPNVMILHLRGGPGSGMLLNHNGEVFKVNTSTEFNRAGAYPAWHPGGELLALSVNKLSMFFHSVGESRDVLDHASDLILYQINSNTVTTCPAIASEERMETFPNWSPDGQYLYFCSAPKLATYISTDSSFSDLLYDQIKYDLMRIRYDHENHLWGELETVLSSAETGKSITMPRVSPDARYLLFCMADYGNFPIYLQSSDLYLLDLKTGEYQLLNVNSAQAETFHSWSSNSRWFVFSSKRRDALTARPYFSYVDENGKVSKPFLLPQSDPEFYSEFLMTYNVPELVKGPVSIPPQQLIASILEPKNYRKAQLDPNVQARPSSKAPETEWRPAPQ